MSRYKISLLNANMRSIASYDVLKDMMFARIEYVVSQYLVPAVGHCTTPVRFSHNRLGHIGTVPFTLPPVPDCVRCTVYVLF